MQKDATENIRKCEQCQKHALLIHQLAGNLNPVSSPWPFAQWGLEIVGPFPRATGNRRFVLVLWITSLNGQSFRHWLISGT